MKLHARHEPMTKARIEMQTAMTDAIGKYHLTYPEIFAILGELVSAWAKWALKDEREP